MSAPATSAAEAANLIPSAEPWPAGLTTIGKSSRASMAGSALAAPRSRNAVSVIDGPDGPEALPLVEAIPVDEDFYDFEARYEIGRTAFRCPADVGDAVTASAQDLALAVYRLLGCYGFARVDLMLDGATGELQVLEANAIPGLTGTSLLPQAAEAAGISFDALIDRVLDLALARTPA